jgi:hypothetical protein
MLKVFLEFDSDTESPNGFDCGWKLYSFSRRHGSFKDPGSFDFDIQTKVNKGEAYWLSYYEHGNCWWGRHDGKKPAGVEFQWDGREYAGLLVWEDPTDPTPPAKSADSFLEEYTDWANGRCFRFLIVDDDKEVIDGCGGYIGVDYFADCVAEAIEGRGEVEFKGEAAWLGEEVIKRLAHV